jgi:hypothetical protein
MFIERLSFIITPADRVEDFIEADEKVWDPWLRQQRGFRKHYPSQHPQSKSRR